LQTGGRAVGATSTRSRSASWASRSASVTLTIPTCSPFGPTSRTSGTRMRSLIRGSTLMWPPWLYLLRPWTRQERPTIHPALCLRALPPTRKRPRTPRARSPPLPVSRRGPRGHARIPRRRYDAPPRSAHERLRRARPAHRSPGGPTRRPTAGQVGGGPPLARQHLPGWSSGKI